MNLAANDASPFRAFHIADFSFTEFTWGLIPTVKNAIRNSSYSPRVHYASGGKGITRIGRNARYIHG